MSGSAARPLAAGIPVQTVSPQELYQVIVGASSQNYEQLRASGERLKQMLDMFGTYDALQEIAAQRNAPLAVRKQAAIQFKNAIVNHWRSRKLLSDTHRMQIRQRCLTFLDEPDDTIAECNKVVVAKVARTDYPNSWPNLISTLVETVDTSLGNRYVRQIQDPLDVLKLKRSLKLLNGIIKEFAGAKMPSTVKAMAQIVLHLKTILYQYYSQMATFLTPERLTVASASSPSTYDDVLLSHLIFKCLAKITTWLWSKNDRLSAAENQQNQAWVQECFISSATQLRSLVQIRKGLIPVLVSEADRARLPGQFTQTLVVLTKHIRTFGKFFRRLQQLSHDRFVALPSAPDLVLFYWNEVVETADKQPDFIADSDDAIYPVRFLVQGMSLFKESLSQWTATKRNGTTNANTLSADFIGSAVRILVTKFIPLRPSDLQSWIADPEEWVQLEDKESDQWEYEIRPCSERLLMQLSNQFPDTTVGLLKQIFDEIAPQRCVDVDSILAKEAVYCSVGRCALKVNSVIPFDDWLNTTLYAESRDTNENYPIIKRRIAWLLGKWVSQQCTIPNNTKVWDILSYMLQHRGSGSDTVVRLTAAAALRECVDIVDFNPNSFAPFLPTVIPEMIRLIGEAETIESKRKVDESLTSIIEQSGQLVLPFMAVITEPIPDLWLSAGDNLLFKASLLVTVNTLIQAVKENSTPLSGLVVPLVRDSLVPSAAVQLDEDALNLWLAALRNTLTLNPPNVNIGLSELIPDAVRMLSANFDLLGTMTRILEAYYLLDAPLIVSKIGEPLFQAYTTTLGAKIIEHNYRELLQSLGLLLTIAPANLWAQPLHTSGLFTYLLKALISGEIETIAATELIYVFARIVMADRQIFLQLVTASAAVLNQTETTVYEGLLDQWWGKFDNMSEPRHRKLSAMGIAALVSTGRPEVLKRLSGEIFNLWLDVLGEVKEVAEINARRNEENDGEPPSPTSLIRYWELDSPPDSYFRESENTPEYERRRKVYDFDPVRTVQLIPFIAKHLQEAQASNNQVFSACLTETDPTVLKQLQDALAQASA